MSSLRLCLALAAALTCAHAQAGAQDQGGRDVTVALFTTRPVRSVALTPAAPGAWTSNCPSCRHKPLTARLTFAQGELYAGGSVHIADGANPSSTASASGLWHIRSNSQGLDVVLTLGSERYTAAVVSAEADADEPDESLRALAVVARTYALNGGHYTAAPGHLPADLCDSTQCQALRLGSIASRVNEAVRATAGETLWFHNSRAEVFFSQHCGGVTASASEAWTAGTSQPYLTTHPDPYCLRRGPAAWHAAVSLDDLAAIARREAWHLPAPIVQITVAQRSPSGRVTRLTLRGADGDTSPLSASALRFAVGRALGWNRIRSDLYDVALRDGALVFDGRGHGHGVGLCQAGASEMAAEHHAAREILAFYFPGTHVGVTPHDDGWSEARLGPLRIRSAAPLTGRTRDLTARAWQDALHRFPVAKAPEPTVLFAPTTELYRQLTGQPGWNLASTSGNIVTLQPEPILQRNHRDEAVTLRHEFLHVLIESEAASGAPLWLREGLAEALSADQATEHATAHATPPGPRPTGLEIEAMLTGTSSAATAEAATAPPAHTFIR